jgi:hypothetical protein
MSGTSAGDATSAIPTTPSWDKSQRQEGRARRERQPRQ